MEESIDDRRDLIERTRSTLPGNEFLNKICQRKGRKLPRDMSFGSIPTLDPSSSSFTIQSTQPFCASALPLPPPLLDPTLTTFHPLGTCCSACIQYRESTNKSADCDVEEGMRAVPAEPVKPDMY